MPEYRQEDADELHRVSGAVFGTWERRTDGTSGDRAPGVLERLERFEILLKYGIGGAGVIGAIMGSLVTLVIQHYWK